MTKPKTDKKKPASTTDADKPKKKPLKRTLIGPAALNETRDIPLIHIKSGEKVIIDTSGKGTLHLREIVMNGGTLEFVKNKNPLTLRVS